MIQTDPIGIAGFGIEGKELLSYFLKIGMTPHLFSDTPIDQSVRHILPPDHIHVGLEIPEDIAIIYKSPGIAPWKIKRKNPNTKISTLTNIFMEKAQGTIIGVTGTKGKSTTTSLIYHILKEAGKSAFLLGNIGTVDLSLLERDKPENIYVYEMSSYMCEFLEIGPKVSVITNLFQDHLDYHLTIENYYQAKQQITKTQTSEDYFITTPELDWIQSPARKILTNRLNYPEGFWQTQLLGAHNLDNIALAASVAQIFEIPLDVVHKAVASYKPLEGRLEKVAEKSGVIFYEDALATIPEATWAAIQSLPNITTLILGGQDRGIDFADFADKLASTIIQNFIIFPETGEKMIAKVQDRTIYRVTSMQEAIQAAYQSGPGICLLSTASPSYNLFKDYKDRSQQFKYWIGKFSNKVHS